ncbi:MAG: phosphoenolpyruvate carboxykinase (ATP), partial [Rhodospirillaceae bacterium]
MENTGFRPSRFGLDNHGLGKVARAHWNLGAPGLFEHALRRQEGRLTAHGAFIALTGEHTGRSPNDRFVVDEPSIHDEIWWGDVNKPIGPVQFDGLHNKVLDHLNAAGEVFVQNCYAGAHPGNRLKVRIITENAWHSLFARNMFITPPDDELDGFEPDFTVLQAPSVLADPATHGTATSTFILVNLAKKMIIVGGSRYAGEIKKSIFSIMN